MEILTGIIQKDGIVLAEDSTIHFLPKRGIDDEGYPEVLLDATSIGGTSEFHRKSIKPYIGMTVEFVRNSVKSQGFNFVILKK